MESKFKVGDKVLLNKPKDTKTSELIWFPKMDKYDGKEFVVRDIGGRVGRYYCTNDGVSLFLCESWLTKSEEQPTEQVTKSIDWENRRWELVCSILVPDFDIPIADGINLVDDLIKQYKQTLK